MHQRFSRRSFLDVLVLAGIGTVYAISLLAMAWHSSLADEYFHVDQVSRFVAGNMTVNPALTQIPGYHAVIAVIASLLGHHSIVAMRMYSSLFGVLAILAFYGVARFYDRVRAWVRTLQFAFFPLLFPYFFLVYTDVLSLLCLLVALLATLKRRPAIAASFSAVSILVRQDNILWVIFLWVFAYFSQNGIRDMRTAAKRLWQWLKNTWPFLIIFCIFAIFVRINGGVALGDKSIHPFPSFHLGNLYFLLFLFFFLFLPLHIANTRRIASFVRRHWTSVLAGTAVLAFIYAWTFVNDNPDNQAAFSFFLRNQLLVYFTSSILLKAVFFVPMLLSLLSLCVTRLTWRSWYLLYPFTILFLVPSWLIEQRYYLVPFTFFLLARERRHWIVEASLLALFAGLTTYLFTGIAQGKFFL